MKSKVIQSISSKEEFDNLPVEERAEYVRRYYDQKVGNDQYATSPDFNLRELEIDFILSHVQGEKILDLGCGNGYTLLRVAEQFEGDSIGIDFSSSLISGANDLLEGMKGKLRGKPVFLEGDAATYCPSKFKEHFDSVITERFLLNLPSQEMQFKVIENIHYLLKTNGTYLMIEGSKRGLDELNTIRKIAGLEPIEDRDKHNLSSRKFDDDLLGEFLRDLFIIRKEVTFDLYYLISRVIYPKMIAPENPSYKHFINETARKLTKYIDFPSRNIGHVKAYVLQKK